MEIGINDIDQLDFEEPIEDTSVDQDEQITNDWGESVEPQLDIISELLKARGIDDANNIKFEDESGAIVNKSWNELSDEEKFTILNQSPDKDPDVDLDDTEIEMINQMRLHGMDPYQYVTALRNQGAAQARSQMESQSENQALEYDTDDLTDDELFILDLQYRSPDMSDEEAYEALNAAKTNSSLFEKQIKGVREYYKKLETDLKSQQQLELQDKQKRQFEQYSNSVVNAIQGINSIGNLEIEMSNEDRDELAQFILGTDQAGINWFGKALEDPETLVRMAWFALKGEEAFNDINQYISQQIKTTAQNSYNRGFEDGKKRASGSSKVVIDSSKTFTPNFNSSRKLDINDLDF